MKVISDYFLYNTIGTSGYRWHPKYSNQSNNVPSKNIIVIGKILDIIF